MFLASNVALQRSSGLDETGPVVWHMALCLLLSTILVAASLIKGIKSSGKVSQKSTVGEVEESLHNPAVFCIRKLQTVAGSLKYCRC